MNGSTKANDPLHPTIENIYNDMGIECSHTIYGLTKREYLAAMAMQGILGDQTYVQPNQCEEVAQLSIKLADALIAELNK